MYAIWIAWGNNYIQEAIASAASLKAQMPDVTTCLFTSDNFKEGFDRVGAVGSRAGEWYTTLVRWCNNALDLLPEGAKCLYFDTDTYIIVPLYDLFDMLDKFDVLGAHAPARFTQPFMPMPISIPDAFPELNIGVMGFRNNAVVKTLFADWTQKQESGKYDNNDQRSLRAALWESDAKLYVLSPEYNFRFGFGGFAGRPVRILHGRSENIGVLAAKVSTRVAMVTWKRGELR